MIDPTISLSTLADKVFLNLAARKAARYILRHNSFCDRLEIAQFMAHADANCAALSREIITQRYRPSASRSVPAPKKVVRENDNVDFTVRNLTHVPFRDQVVFTAVAVLFADQWETLWGDPQEEGFPKLFSLGNRLALTWAHDPPHLSIGSSKLYRDWADDYPKFVKSTEEAFNKSLERLKKGERLALLSLDVRNFYPSVNRHELVRRLTKRTEDQALKTLLDKAFHSFPVEAVPGSDELPLRDLDVEGLPQGLAASGFFANVYLEGFDRWVLNELATAVPSLPGLKVLFYTRYVDDMRVLVRYRAGAGAPRTTAANHPVFQAIISRLNDDQLKVAPEKCGLIEATGGQRRLTQGQLAERMQDLRKRVYLPLTPEDALEAGKDLEMLFSTETVEAPRDRTDQPLHPLLLDGPGVRKGSRQRFAAGWWAHLWCDQLKFDETMWKGRGERFADILVREWHDDPSQVRLLKIAIDIGATEKSTQIAWERLRELRYVNRDWFNFILSDLLDHQAFRWRPLNNRKHFLALRRYAISIVRTQDEPWFLKDKAACFLSTVALGAREQSKLREAAWDGSSVAFQVLRALLDDSHALEGLSPFEALAIVRALRIPSTRTSTILRRLFAGYAPRHIEKALPALSTAVPELALWLIRHGRTKSLPQRLIRFYRDAALEAKGEASRLKVTGSAPYLASLIQQGYYRHPVTHAALAVNLLELLSRTTDLEGLGAQGQLNPWNLIVGPKGLAWTTQRTPVEGYIGYPGSLKWIKSGMATPPRWALPCGLILRAAATGKLKHLPGATPNQRYSMWLDPSSLVRDGAQLEERMLNLLSRLFAWPGTLTNPPKTLDEELAEARAILESQKSLSITLNGGPPGPAIVSVSAPAPSEDGRLTVAICQLDIPKLPSVDAEEVACRTAIRRALKMVQEHKRHLGGQTPLNVIVFPELSIPPSALGDLIRFSSREGIIILGGLSYVLVPSPLGPRRLNRLAWIIPADIRTPVGRHSHRRTLVLLQDKIHPSPLEAGLTPPTAPASPPVIWRLSLRPRVRVAALNCYEFTDIDIRSLVRGRTEGLIVSAHNPAVNAFDTLVEASHYDLYAHVVLVNSGKFGGSSIRAPYKKPHERQIFDIHGNALFAVNVRILQLSDAHASTPRRFRAQPAGFAWKS